jgi:hypothetical protein
MGQAVWLWFISKMWAMLDRDNETVIACFPPTIAMNDILKEADGRQVIQMTLENSPAHINGKYKNGVFYSPEENN